MRAPASTSGAAKREKTLEESFWENYSPPAYIRNKYFWAASAVVASGMIYYSIVYRDCVPM